mmetsp:Transcript_103162/g.272619  ORF Transcript_103162/g.272619 Transcript_103162/m.272619 type:complete len:238 (+) Transcript_103162:411-1124(+)
MDTPMVEEDEFKNRDRQGLTPRKEDDPADEDMAAKAQAGYMKMIFGAIPIAQCVFAISTYFACRLLGMKDALETKFAFLHDHDLGYVYLAVYIIGLGRARMAVNSNAMRAAARVDRPDQHVYKIMTPSGETDAPYVLMANTGWVGKFNRAQRGAFNTDEQMPMVLINTVLAGCVFGPVVVFTALLGAYGRVKFALGYTAATNSRIGGFLPAIIAENWAAGLVLFSGVKAVVGGRFPF